MTAMPLTDRPGDAAPGMDARLILLAPQDNCVIAAAALEAGTELDLDGERIILGQPIELGHKLARRALAPQEKVMRYGAVIGHVTQPVAKGAHLHTHNLASDYLPTYTHDQGHAFVAH